MSIGLCGPMDRESSGVGFATIAQRHRALDHVSPHQGGRVQTAAIRYRVADFLKQHPPFQLMEEPDLLALVNRGRVKFHEADEFLCWQGSAYAQFVFVIQQGAVALWEEID